MRRDGAGLEADTLQACKGIPGEAYKAMSSAEASAEAGAGQPPTSPAPALEQGGAEGDLAASARHGSSESWCHTQPCVVRREIRQACATSIVVGAA